MRVGISSRAQTRDVFSVLERSSVNDIPSAKALMRHYYHMSGVTWVGMVDGIPACVWGMIPPTVLGSHAYLWLLTSDLVEEHKFLFVRHSQRFIQIMLETYPIIVGHCEIGQDKAIRWVRWLGGKFGESDGKLVPFEIRQSDG